MWIKIIIITFLIVIFSIFLIPLYVVIVMSQKWDWEQIKKIYWLWWTQD
jgi:ABC-type glycerol-3-phosphate transport system permease component